MEPEVRGVCFCDQFLKILQFYVINPKLGQQGSKLLFHIPMAIERWKSIVKGNLRWTITFWIHYLKILTFLTFLKVLTSRGNVINPKIAEKIQIGTSCANVDRKMRIKSKRYFQVNYSFMNLFSQNFEWAIISQLKNWSQEWIDNPEKI